MEHPRNKFNVSYYRSDEFKAKAQTSSVFPNTNIIVPKNYITYADTIKNFQVRSDDVLITGLYKSGNTWLSELVWCIVNDLNFEEAKKVDLTDRMPSLERHLDLPSSTLDSDIRKCYEFFAQMKSPRIFRSHAQWSILPMQFRSNKNVKILYICRKPKDVIVSLLNMCRSFGNTPDTDQMVDLLISDRLTYCPYFKHVLDFWNASKDTNSNILFLRYENLKLNTRSVIQQIGEFLGKQLSEKEVTSLVEHTSFQSMKNNPAVNRTACIGGLSNDFMFQGQIDGYKNYLSRENIEKIDDWIFKTTEKTELKFLRD